MVLIPVRFLALSFTWFFALLRRKRTLCRLELSQNLTDSFSLFASSGAGRCGFRPLAALAHMPIPGQALPPHASSYSNQFEIGSARGPTPGAPIPPLQPASSLPTSLPPLFDFFRGVRMVQGPLMLWTVRPRACASFSASFSPTVFSVPE